MRTHVTFTLNGDQAELLPECGTSLLEALRDDAGLTGVKEGCGTGDCGSCSVLVDGVLNCSCLMFIEEVDGREVTTVEGLAQDGLLHPLQQAFLEGAALQCGICTPGVLMAAKALLDRNPNPTESEIRYGLAGNLCRCTGYDKIVRSVQEAVVQIGTSATTRNSNIEVNK